MVLSTELRGHCADLQGFYLCCGPPMIPRVANWLLNLPETRGLGPPQTVSVAFSKRPKEPAADARQTWPPRWTSRRRARGPRSGCRRRGGSCSCLRCCASGAWEYTLSTCTASSLQAAGLPRQVKTSETHAAWPRVQRFLPREHGQELAGLAGVVVLQVRSEESMVTTRSAALSQAPPGAFTDGGVAISGEDGS